MVATSAANMPPGVLFAARHCCRKGTPRALGGRNGQLLMVPMATASFGAAMLRGRRRQITRRRAATVRDLLLGGQETQAAMDTHQEDPVATVAKSLSRATSGRQQWTQSVLQSMIKADLVELCQSKGLKNTSRCKKYELIEFLLEQSSAPHTAQQSLHSADLSSLALSTHGLSSVEETLRAVFTTARVDGRALQLPSTFGPKERALAHRVAEDLGLNHESHGDGPDRQLWIWSTRVTA